MAYDAFTIFTYTNSVVFPDTEAINSSGALSTDGTEFVKKMIDNWMFGRQQALLNHVGITPNGVAEADGASQELLALQRMGMHPGQGIFAFWNDTPANLGIRVLMLTGQGILRANYVDLDSAVYVGDTDNPTASAFYRADNSDGSSRNVAGVYLILPDARGQTIRGLDLAAAVDPDGASRDLGSLQVDAFQGHWTNIFIDSGTPVAGNGIQANTNGTIGTATNVGFGGNPITDGVNDTPRTDSETRMTNMACDIGIIY